MDLSDLVHGMKKKKPKQREDSRDNGAGHSSQRETSSRQPSSSRRHATPGGGSSSHAASKPRDESRNSPDSSSPSPPRVSHRDKGSSSSNQLQCDLCDRTFDSKTNFDRHSQVFHRRSKVPSKPREASFKCPDCGKAFTSPSKRNVHQNATHMGLRPYRCDICSKSFGYKGDLTKHMATHSGIKAHSCYICGQRFARNFYVKRHIETVHEKKGTRKKD